MTIFYVSITFTPDHSFYFINCSEVSQYLCIEILLQKCCLQWCRRHQFVWPDTQLKNFPLVVRHVLTFLPSRTAQWSYPPAHLNGCLQWRHQIVWPNTQLIKTQEYTLTDLQTLYGNGSSLKLNSVNAVKLEN